VDYALGAAGVAVAGAIVTYFIGKEKASFIILGGMLVAMVLLFVFARLVSAKSQAATNAGIVLLWAVTTFFCIFLLFTATAFAFGWPIRWSTFLGVSEPNVVKNDDAQLVRSTTLPDPMTACAPSFENGRIAQKCNLSVAQARATASATFREITNKVALVLSEKDIQLFPRMLDYMKETDQDRREAIWGSVKNATTGDFGLLTLISDASKALSELDARLRTDAGAELAHDPAGVRAILLSISTKQLSPREDVGKAIAKSKNPTNETVKTWYDDLQILVKALEKDLAELSRKLAEPV
jgi:hypothetical protein